VILITQRFYTDFLTRAQFFFVQIKLAMDMHPSLLIKPQGTGQVLPQPGFAKAAPVKLAKTVLQER